MGLRPTLSRKKLSIGIIDIGMGNIGSVYNALYSQAWDPILVKCTEDFDELTHLIIPGVGSYAAAMKILGDWNLIDSIIDFAAEGKPTLGICLGMQLLSDVGFEGMEAKGLGLIEGKTVPFEKTRGLSFPHIGWNEVLQERTHPILNGIKSGLDFYFVNGFFFNPVYSDTIIATTDYGQLFPSIIGKKNVVGVQFHPEKSQTSGLKIIDNFCLWDGKC